MSLLDKELLVMSLNAQVYMKKIENARLPTAAGSKQGRGGGGGEGGREEEEEDVCSWIREILTTGEGKHIQSVLNNRTSIIL